MGYAVLASAGPLFCPLLCFLLQPFLNNLCFIVSVDRVIMNGDVKRSLKKAVIAQRKILSQLLFSGTAENL